MTPVEVNLIHFQSIHLDIDVGHVLYNTTETYLNKP